MTKTLKIKDRSIPLLFLALLLPLGIPLVGRLAGVSISLQTSSILLILGSMFVLVEIRILSALKIRNLKKDYIKTLGIIVAISGLVVGALQLANIGVNEIFVNLSTSLVGLYVIVEALR
ncbi:MAG: hypothetical protein ACOCV1_01675 [Bacillota bacterium]